MLRHKTKNILANVPTNILHTSDLEQVSDAVAKKICYRTFFAMFDEKK